MKPILSPGERVKRRNITGVHTVFGVDKNVVLKNDIGVFYTISILAFYQDYVGVGYE
jgi:hypothetical protein